MYWADLGLLQQTFENTRMLEDEKLQVMQGGSCFRMNRLTRSGPNGCFLNLRCVAAYRGAGG